MIKNIIQLKNSEKVLNLFEGRLKYLRKNKTECFDEVGYNLELASLTSQYDELKEDIINYKKLINSEIHNFYLNSWSQVDNVIISAKISKGYNESELAKLINISKAEIDFFEKNSYTLANHSLIKRICQVLKIEVNQDLFKEYSIDLNTLINRVRKIIDLPIELIRKYFIPNEFISKFEEFKGVENLNMNEVIVKLTSNFAEYFGMDVNKLLTDNTESLQLQLQVSPKFKRLTNSNTKKINAITAIYILMVMQIINENKLKIDDYRNMTTEIIRKNLFSDLKVLDVEHVLDYLWNLGIMVFPVTDAPSFHGAFIQIEKQPVILISTDIQYPDKLIFNMLHELYHAIEEAGVDFFIVEETPSSIDVADTDIEIAANEFAGEIILNGRHDILAKHCVKIANGSVQRLKKAVEIVAMKEGVSVPSLANYLAYRLMLQKIDWWGAAQNLQGERVNFHNLFVDRFLKHINISKIEEPYLSILLKMLRG